MNKAVYTEIDILLAEMEQVQNLDGGHGSYTETYPYPLTGNLITDTTSQFTRKAISSSLPVFPYNHEGAGGDVPIPTHYQPVTLQEEANIYYPTNLTDNRMLLDEQASNRGTALISWPAGEQRQWNNHVCRLGHH